METWFKQIKGHVYFCILILVSVFSIWKRILEEQGPGWASPWRNINRQLCAGCRGASVVKLVVDLAKSLFVCVNIGNKWTYSYFHTLASNMVPGRPLLCNVARHNVTMLELHKFKWSPSLLTAHTTAHSSPPSTDTATWYKQQYAHAQWQCRMKTVHNLYFHWFGYSVIIWFNLRLVMDNMLPLCCVCVTFHTCLECFNVKYDK